MRLAPVPMLYAGNIQSAIENSGLSSRTTHGTRAAVDACRYFGALISAALNGIEKDDLLNRDLVNFVDPLTEEIEQVASGSFKEKNPPQIRGSGYVVKSLEAALWVFFHSGSFRSGSLLAVNLGEDADTTGAVYGQLAGAYYGESGISSGWRSILALQDLIRTYADQIYVLSRNLD